MPGRFRVVVERDAVDLMTHGIRVDELRWNDMGRAILDRQFAPQALVEREWEAMEGANPRERALPE